MRLIPPVAVPFGCGSVAAAFFSATPAAFGEALAARAGRDGFAFHPSGRAALAAQLAVWGGAGRSEVIVPAYTCWTVAASVVRAGLRVRAVDVDPETLDYAPGALSGAAGESTVAIVAAHLFARTADTARAATCARACGAHSIDDAAQALPDVADATDATVLSFGRGKPLALGTGGALLGGAPARHAARRGGSGGAVKLGLTTLLARPAWYRLPSGLPFLGIGRTVYDPSFATDGGLHRWQERLGARLLAGYDEAARRRSAHARRLVDALDGCRGWRVPARDAVREAPVRLPLLAPDRAWRDRLVESLHRRGVAAAPMYPAPLTGIPELAPHLAHAARCPGAEELAARLVTLPTYPTLSERDGERVAQAVVTTIEEGR